jgi:hypothetical protein
MSKKTLFELMQERKKNNKGKEMVCSNCKYELAKDWIACPSCGEPVKKKKQEFVGKDRLKRRYLIKESEDELPALEEDNEEEETLDEDDEVITDDDLDFDITDEDLEDDEEEDGESSSEEESDSEEEAEDVSTDEVLKAVEDMLKDTNISVTDAYEKLAFAFNLSSEDGNTAKVVFDGASVQVFSGETGELVSSMQAETLDEFLDALKETLTQGNEESEEEEEVSEEKESTEESSEGEEKSEESEESDDEVITDDDLDFDITDEDLEDDDEEGKEDSGEKEEESKVGQVLKTKK